MADQPTQSGGNWNRPLIVFLHDSRLALRSIQHNPFMALLIVAVIAIGISTSVVAMQGTGRNTRRRHTTVPHGSWRAGYRGRRLRDWRRSTRAAHDPRVCSHAICAIWR
jgi:hypothetical protein